GHLVRDYPRLYRLFRRLQPAVVHTRNLAALEAVVPAWAAGVPVRIHGEHGWEPDDPDRMRPRHPYLPPLYLAVVRRHPAPSPLTRARCAPGAALPPHRVSQIYTGVATERFRPAEARRPIAGCPFVDPADFLVGWIGRMDPVKDLPTLLQAFARARQRAGVDAR